MGDGNNWQADYERVLAQRKELDAQLEAAREELHKECEKRGLPDDLPGLLRHIENNHALALEFERLAVEAAQRRIEELEEDNAALRKVLGDALDMAGGK